VGYRSSKRMDIRVVAALGAAIAAELNSLLIPYSFEA